MVNLIAIGNGLDAIVDALSQEFKVSKKAIYADYERMEKWVHDLQADEQLCARLKQRLEYLNRVAIDMLLDLGSSEDGKKRQLTVKEQFAKIGIINAILRVTMEQIKLGQELGLIERKPVEVLTVGSLNMPFECDPELKGAILRMDAQLLEERQRNEEAQKRKEAAAAEKLKEEEDHAAAAESASN